MGWPNRFQNATNPEQLVALDQNFDQAAAMLSIPCTASGSNTISLTPNINCPVLTAYNELGGYRFIAAATSTGPVTLQYNGLSLLPLYKADGATQCNVGDIISGQQYVATFHQALNGGLGGFYAESPSISSVVNSSQFTPGGRLTLQSATPVMFTNQTAQQTIYYAPYNHPLIALYNGSIIQMTQFTSSLSDQVGLSLSLGGGAQWTANSNFDLYVTLIGATPTLVGVKWTNNTTRATTLSVFGGMLTNSGSCTAFTGPATSVTMPINQGTFVGTVQISNVAGQTLWQFGGAASGGTAAFLNLCNYYNAVFFTTAVVDSGVSYTYTPTTIRQARASSGNQINFLQASSERAIVFRLGSVDRYAAAVGAQITVAVGLNSTTAGLQNFTSGNSAAANEDLGIAYSVAASFTGYGFGASLEGSDGTNANTFNLNTSQFSADIWL